MMWVVPYIFRILSDYIHALNSQNRIRMAPRYSELTTILIEPQILINGQV